MTAKSRQRRYERRATKFQRERRKLRAEELALLWSLRNIIPPGRPVPANLKDVSPHRYLTEPTP